MTPRARVARVRTRARRREADQIAPTPRTRRRRAPIDTYAAQLNSTPYLAGRPAFFLLVDSRWRELRGGRVGRRARAPPLARPRGREASEPEARAPPPHNRAARRASAARSARPSGARPRAPRRARSRTSARAARRPTAIRASQGPRRRPSQSRESRGGAHTHRVPGRKVEAAPSPTPTCLGTVPELPFRGLIVFAHFRARA